MEFINIKRLKSALSQGELSARETAKYLAAQGVLLSLVFIPTPGAEPPDWPFVAYPLVALGGVYYCYRRNGADVGKRFAERYLAVGWVVGWRVALVSITAVVLTVLGSLLTVGNFDWFEEPRFAVVVDVGSLSLVAFVYWRIGVHLGHLAGPRAISESAT